MALIAAFLKPVGLSPALSFVMQSMNFLEYGKCYSFLVLLRWYSSLKSLIHIKPLILDPSIAIICVINLWLNYLIVAHTNLAFPNPCKVRKFCEAKKSPI